jgi:hypothetical protein
MEKYTDKSFYYLASEAGLANTQYAFSRLCGRNPTWFATIAARGIPMSIAALGTLAANVALTAEHERDGERKQALLAVHSKLVSEMASRCRAKALSRTSQCGPSPHEFQ